jgi:hypothetical protein
MFTAALKYIRNDTFSIYKIIQLQVITDAGEKQEKARSKTQSRGNPDVTRILAPLSQNL